MRGAVDIGIGVIYFFLGLETAKVATKKGRSHLVWFLYAAVAPGISLIHALLLDRGKRPTPHTR